MTIKLLQLLRVESWVSKLPGFFAAAFVIALHQEVSTSALLYSCGFLLTHLCTGYLVNDLADWDSDLASGDERAVHQLGKRAGYAMLLLFTVLHLLVCAQIAATDLNRWGLLLGLTLLHFIYSIPPRLKGRGIWGAASSAVNQWVAPTAVLVMQTGFDSTAVVLIIWLFLVGINGAVRHQVRDYLRDQAGEVNTFVQRITPAGAVRLLVWVQRLAMATPLVLLAVLPLAQAFIALVDLIGFTVYHTLYYKRLKTDEVGNENKS